MGYYANGSGTFCLVDEADWTENQKKEMKLRIAATDMDVKLIYSFASNPTMETLLDLLPCDCALPEYYENHTEVSVFLDEKYHEDDWKEFLSVVAPVALKGSEIEFIGEDSSMWRFICLKDKSGFVEQQGRVVYE